MKALGYESDLENDEDYGANDDSSMMPIDVEEGIDGDAGELVDGLGYLLEEGKIESGIENYIE